MEALRVLRVSTRRWVREASSATQPASHSFESTEDPRIPELFACYPCRFKSDAVGAVVHEKAISVAMDDFRSLALYRRGKPFAFRLSRS